MNESNSTDRAVERQLELQEEIDSIVSEIEARRTERSRSRFVTTATLLVAVPLFWAIDLPGLAGQFALLAIGGIGFFAAWSFVHAELSSIGFYKSAKQRLDVLTSQDMVSQDSES